MRILNSLLLPLLFGACAPEQPPSAPASAAVEQRTAAPDRLLEDVRILSADDMQGRLVGSPAGARARAYITGRMNEIGLKPLFDGGFESSFPVTRDGQPSPLPGVNLLARIEGTSDSDRALVVMAHYDHVGVQGGAIYNGADDNASGVAVVLKISESLKAKPPTHDVILALVDGEEGGLRGSRAMVSDERFAKLLPSIVLAVNLDMVSRNDRNELYASGAHHFPWLGPRLEVLSGEVPVTLMQGHDDRSKGEAQDWTTQSDHMAFHEARVPWVYFGVEDHPDYHKPTDDFGRIPEDFFRKSAASIDLAVRAFDRDLGVMAKEAGREGR